MRIPILLTDLREVLSADVYHRVLGWLGMDVELFHEWLEGHCPCSVFEDVDDEESLAA